MEHQDSHRLVLALDTSIIFSFYKPGQKRSVVACYRILHCEVQDGGLEKHSKLCKGVSTARHWAHSWGGAVICHTVMDRATGPTTETHLGKLHQETKKEHGPLG